MNVINIIREKNPLIHHFTNQVVMNFTANGLLAFGGSPIMAKDINEIKEVVQLADGVLINIGTLNRDDVPAMILAGQTANEQNIPVVLDPVGVSASSFRKQTVEQLLRSIKFTAIKGNAGEIAQLAGVTWQTKGIDAEDGSLVQLEKIAKRVAKKWNLIVIVTGKIDVISDGIHVKTNDTGHPMLTKVTGAGCLLGSLITASLTVEGNSLLNIYDVVTFYGEKAQQVATAPHIQGPGTFQYHFLDALSSV